MSFFSRRRCPPRHERRHIPAQTASPPPRPAAEFPAARRMRADETTPIPVTGARPYVPPPPPPPPPVSQSPVREAVWLTARASNFRYPLCCVQCHGGHVNLNADTFADLYASARNAKWQEDQFRTWRRPRCARRHQATFGVAPVAAIEVGAT